VPTPARINLAALGDFPTSNRSAESLSLTAQNTKLEFPLATLALEANASADSSDQVFIGYGERQGDQLDFLLWPRARACELLSGGPYPGALGGEALGYSSSAGLVLLAGSNDGASSAVVGAATFDTRTGEAWIVDPRSALSEPRAFATVSELGAKLLVAGGENPIHDPSHPASVLRGSAEIYDPATRGFEPELVKLVEPTTRHAAATLDSGETVLIGGRIEASAASPLVQLISPATKVSKLLKQLSMARTSATVVHLSDGRLLVAGGENSAASPVAELEWRAADGSAQGAPFSGQVSLPARYQRAFIALEGGAALAVGGCQDRPAAPGEDCSTECERGCPPEPDSATAQRYDAFWISAEGSVSRLDFPISAGHPVLLPGTDGRPWLIANSLAGTSPVKLTERVLYRFDPWQKAFRRVSSNLAQAITAQAPRFVAAGPDAFIWFELNEQIPVTRGVRLGTRSRFSNDVSLVSLRDPEDPQLPAHLAPDHPPGSDVQYDGALGILTFAAVAAGASSTCVWIADARYADFSARIELASSTLPTLRIGPQSISDATSSDADPACVLPAASDNPKPDGTLLLERRGTQLSLSVGTLRSSCQIPTGHLPFGLCQSQLGPTQVTQLSVIRTAH